MREDDAMSEESQHPEDAARAADHDEQREAMAPGDEAPPGDPTAGENLCRTCAGTGEVDGRTCPTCEGTGRTTSAVSGGP
jgi:RecJ-like exonuclease